VTDTLPFAWYVDDEQLRRERATIFARSWQYAGRAAEVAEPGSFLATDAGGVPIVVTRDDVRARRRAARGAPLRARAAL
jgi:phenylpropionate dioxygenase-like ring-hydroxylating dioxygenase large terminal subunit